MPAKLDRIKDASLRESLTQAKASLRQGNYPDVVHRAAEAYAELVRRKPEMLEGQTRLRTIFFFPRLGAQLQVGPDGQAKIVYDRDRFIFSEAITYFEFAVDCLVREGL